MTKKKVFVPYPKFREIPPDLFSKLKYKSIFGIDLSSYAKVYLDMKGEAAFDTLSHDKRRAICDNLYVGYCPNGYDFATHDSALSDYLYDLVDDAIDEYEYFVANDKYGNHHSSCEMAITFYPTSGDIQAEFVAIGYMPNEKTDEDSHYVDLSVTSRVQQMLLLCKADGDYINQYINSNQTASFNGEAVKIHTVVTYMYTVIANEWQFSEPKTRPMTFYISCSDNDRLKRWLSNYPDNIGIQARTLVGGNKINAVSTSITFFGHRLQFQKDSLEYRLAKYLLIRARANHAVFISTFYESEPHDKLWDELSPGEERQFNTEVYQAARQLNKRIQKQFGLKDENCVITANSQISLNMDVFGLAR